jgi:hypothetical protein
MGISTPRAAPLIRDPHPWLQPLESRMRGRRAQLVVEALALYHTHRRELAFIGASEMRSLEAANRARITKSRNELQHTLDSVIDAGVATGEFGVRHPRHAGRAISTMCTSLPQWYRPDGPSTPEQVAREYADFALDLLRRQARPSSNTALN